MLTIDTRLARVSLLLRATRDRRVWPHNHRRRRTAAVSLERMGIMGEAAKAYWMESWIEQELVETELESPISEDLELLCSGVNEALWLYGSD